MLNLGVEFLGNQGGGVKIDHVRDGVHLAHLHKLGNNLGSALLQAGSQLTDGNLIRDGDFQLRVAGLLQLDALQSLSLGLTAAAKLLAAAVVAVVELFLFAGGGNGDYNVIVLAPASVQEMADFVDLALRLPLSIAILR